MLYVSPKKYGGWLSKGYRHFSLLPFFEGPAAFDKKIALLILTGFEDERAINLIRDIEPAAIFFGFSEPGTDPHFAQNSLKALEEIRARSSIHTETIKIAGNDPFKCRDTLEDLFQRLSPEYDFFVAPIGPKPGVVGLYLAYERNPSFRIIYPYTMLYNVHNYSTGCRDFYQLVLENNFR